MTSPPIAGPRSGIAIQSACFYARAPQYLERCRERFGPIFRLQLWGMQSKEIVFITDRDLAEQALRGPSTQVLGGEPNQFLSPVLGRQSMLVMDGPAHQHWRRLLLTLMHSDFLAQARELSARHARAQIATWRDGAPVNTLAAARDMILDLMTPLLFGAVEPSRLRRALQLVSAASRSWGAFYMPWDVTALSPYRRFRQRLLASDEIIFQAIAEARRRGRGQSAQGGVLGWLLAHGGRELHDQAIRDNLVTLFLAAHGSTAVATAWLLQHLAFDAAAQRTAAAGGLANPRDEFDAVDSLVREALRTHPPFEFVLRIVRGGPLPVGGHLVPDGAMVAISLSALHGDEQTFTDPARFCPARFPDARMPRGYMPFGYGSRRCVGASLAHTMIRSIVVTVVTERSLRPAGAFDRRVRRGITFAPARGAVVLTEKRAAAP